MLPYTVLTRSQFGVEERGFEPTTLWYDPVVGYMACLLAAFLAAQVRTAPDRSDRSTANVSKIGADAQIDK